MTTITAEVIEEAINAIEFAADNGCSVHVSERDCFAVLTHINQLTARNAELEKFARIEGVPESTHKLIDRIEELEELQLEWQSRAEKAEAELARRDALPPVAYRWRWSDDAPGDWRYTEEARKTNGSVTAESLFTAAPAPAPVVVTDDMAMAFHQAITDGDIGADDIEEIKVGLRAALLCVTAATAPVAPDEATPDNIETLVGSQLRQGLGVAWDIDQRNSGADSWNACRAAMLKGGA